MAPPAGTWSGARTARLVTLLAVLAGVTAMHVLATVTGPGHGVAAVSHLVISAPASPHSHGAAGVGVGAGPHEVGSGARGGEHGAMGACTLLAATGLALLGALLAASTAGRAWLTVPDPSRAALLRHSHRGPPGRRWPRVASCVIRV